MNSSSITKSPTSNKTNNSQPTSSLGAEKEERNQQCPYLDTITRTLLDFDLPISCSVTLSSGPHIYACLVCGQYFRGKGWETPAHTHAMECNHLLFMHLHKGTVWCLPEEYEVKDSSLEDIQRALKPRFSEKEIGLLDREAALGRDLFGRRYLPGFVGMNNLNKSDCLNATVQALAHVRPLRDFFLRCSSGQPFTIPLPTSSNRKKRKRTDKVLSVDPMNFSPLVQAFGSVLCKLWSPDRFKSTLDAHTLVHAISVASNKLYCSGKQAPAGEFVPWLLHQLHIGMGGTRKTNSSVIHLIFRGQVEITTRQRKSIRSSEQAKEGADTVEPEEDRLGSDNEEDVKQRREERERKALEESQQVEEIVTQSNFLQLTLDIPEKPLFKDEEGGLVIPQEPLVNILKKFDGITFSDAIHQASGMAVKRRYRVQSLPDYLILCLGRFTKNKFAQEKNPTIVPFPVQNLDLSRYVFNEKGSIPKEEEVRKMSVKELKNLLRKYNHSDLGKNLVEKSELIKVCLDFLSKSVPDLLVEKYDLVANITHDIPAEVGREGQSNPLEEGSYRCHVQDKASGTWYDLQDLHVKEIMPQLIGVSESYVLFFEKKRAYR